MKRVLLVLFIFAFLSSSAQNMAINSDGSSAHSKAILELKSTDKGFLVPRMTQAQRLSMFSVNDATAKAMLVYQTDGTEGYYYYNGSAWKYLQTSGSGWELTGNSGTDDASNFIGTADSKGLAVKTNNTLGMFMTTDQKVTIGATNNFTRLYVRASDSAAPSFAIRNTHTHGYSGIWFVGSDGLLNGHIGFGNPSSPKWQNQVYLGSIANYPVLFTTYDIERMRISEAGNVGIGTDAPSRKLHVSRASSGITPNANATIVAESSSYNYFNLVTQGESGVLFSGNNFASDGGIVYNSPSFLQGLMFRTNTNQTRMVINKDGDVGVGTISPSNKFHVYRGSSGITANTNATIVAENSGSNYLNLITPGESGVLFGANGTDNDGGVIYNNTSLLQGLMLKTNGNTARMVITKDGLVGVGTTAPTNKLHIYNSSSGITANASASIVTESSGSNYLNLLTPGESGVLFGANGTGTDGGMVYNNSGLLQGLIFRTNNNTNRMVITKDGDVGIGTTTPASTLEVNGYTKLGSDAPAVKMKKITGTTAASQGSTTTIALGITDASKIISIDVMVEWTTNSYLHPNYTHGAGFNFNWYTSGTSIVIANVASSSINILSKPVKIIVTYEE